MTAIICIALFLAGFAFPPLWLGLVGYIIYRERYEQPTFPFVIEAAR